MGMPVEFNTMIVTKGKETRIEENVFELMKEGYRIYPLNIPLEVRKRKTEKKREQHMLKSWSSQTISRR